MSGTIGNGGETSRHGSFAAKDYIGKLGLSGKHKVTVTLNGEGGASCTVTVWIYLHGPFWKSVFAVGGSGLVLLSFVLLFLGAPQYMMENLVFQGVESRLGEPEQHWTEAFE